MQCPIDQSELRLAERQGVEIDYCPHCRGVWLDRGELDKILERESTDIGADHVRRSGARPVSREHVYEDRDDAWDEHDGGRRRRRGWLGDLFEFGG
jgi:Zn-finger nucleic acid-binding protein